MMARKYSKKEMDFIMNNYKTMSNQEIGKVLNLSREAVRSKLRRLGLKKSFEDIQRNYQDNKIKCGHKGDKHPQYGKSRSKEVAEKISKKLTGIPRPENKIQLQKYREEYGSWNKSLPPHLQPRYLGGISDLGYDLSIFNKKFKHVIKIRDGFLCLKCMMREEDSKNLFGIGLHIHHINYDKKLTIKENCCSLCARCNSEVNSNRPHWIKFFQSILSERYNYQYNPEGTIIINSIKHT